MEKQTKTAIEKQTKTAIEKQTEKPRGFLMTMEKQTHSHLMKD
jgi:hypothetical protein